MRLIRILVAAVLLYNGYLLYQSFNSSPITSKFSHKELEEIDPVLIVDYRTLVDQASFSGAVSAMLTNLVDRGILLAGPYGTTVNPNVAGYSIPIIIESSGGYVSLGNQLKSLLKPMRDNGLLINCYVAEAKSMAFNIVVTSCDKVIAKSDAVFMQHRTHCGMNCSTASTVHSDVKLAKEEAKALGIKYADWLSLTRGEDDKIFSKEEIKKYKLVDEWME
jgi:hypothetical protein